MMNTTHDRTSAIVIGAGMAGLLAARALSDRVDEVTVLERRRVSRSTSRTSSDHPNHPCPLPPPVGQQLGELLPGLVRADISCGAGNVSRQLLEDMTGRRLLRRRTNIRLIDGIEVNRPLVEDGRVVGVLIERRELRADLTIDCSGSDTRSFAFLEEAGYPVPSTLVARTSPDRFSAPQLRAVRQLERTPVGFVAVGDAVVRFDPEGGPGVASAALQADALGEAIKRHGVRSPKLAPAVYRRTARATVLPWRLASRDEIISQPPEPDRRTLVSTRLLHRLLAVGDSSPRLARRIARVEQLMSPPTSLFTPDILTRLMLHGDRTAHDAGAAHQRCLPSAVGGANPDVGTLSFASHGKVMR